MSTEDQKPSKLAVCLAEFIGTAMLLFFGCMGCISDYYPAGTITHFLPCLTFGLTVFVIIQIFGHISGAHLNPAVTIATIYMGMLEYHMIPIYIVPQFAGAFLGFAALKALVPAEYTAQEVFDEVTNTTTTRLGLCTTVPDPLLHSGQAFCMEMLATAVLILVCCSIWDKRNSMHHESLPLRFGFVVATLAMTVGPLTGCSMNTARSFAPALLNGNWKDHWVYWLGPNMGALVGCGFYKSVFSLPDDDKNKYVAPSEQTENVEESKV